MDQFITIDGTNFNVDITELNLMQYQLTELTNDIGNLIQLTSLNLSMNKLSVLPSEIGNLSQLTEFNLSSNELLELPQEFGNLTQLTELDLNYNKIVDLPREINNLALLAKLFLSCQLRLVRLPLQICSLTGLTYLDLSFNKLRELPLDIGNLTQLTFLDLGFNQLRELPISIGNLTRLTYLDLSVNNLIQLPLEIVNLTELTEFYYHDNPIENLLHPIINRFIDRLINIDLFVSRNGTIYTDAENIHTSSIQQSIKDSIFKLMKNYNDEYELNYLANDILTQKTKEAIAEFCDNKDVHSILNITFEEILKAVFIEIESFDEETQNSILEILNQEMEDSICKCFTGRISRLINCLSVFSDKVSIKISTNEEISNIIITLKQKIHDIDELKRAIAIEMTERGYDEATINEWLLFVE